jgi:hypothetical protein
MLGEHDLPIGRTDHRSPNGTWMSGQQEGDSRRFADRASEARRRAEEAERRVVELRAWLAQASGEPALFVSSNRGAAARAAAVVTAGLHADGAARRLRQAYDRAADAHERAAVAHDWLADRHPADGLGVYHQRRAAQHRRSAECDRAASTRNE